jgi:hypothetical protein
VSTATVGLGLELESERPFLRRIRWSAEGGGCRSLLAVLRSDTVLERRGQLCNRGTGCLRVASQLATDGLLAFSALGNFASAGRWENFLLGPDALTVSLLCLIVALNPS